MKAFLDYVSKITIKEPVWIKDYNKSIEIYIGDTYIDDIWKDENYYISRKIPIKYKLIGKSRSFFTEDIIYIKLLRYRFI